jgi:MoaA/NifB/PqqE/SkfB family radical SAM enzyme
MLTVSINPTYLCNFRCEFCYLTSSHLLDKKKLSKDVLEQRLIDIQKNGYKIDHVDLYGGEIGLLPLSYLEEMDDLLKDDGNPSINIISNLSLINPYFLKEHVELSVSFDFEHRQEHEKVLQNIIGLPRDISICKSSAHLGVHAQFLS